MNSKSAEELFWEACQLDSEAEREAYLEEHCAGEAPLRKKVDLLLAARSQAEGFLDSPPAGLEVGRTIEHSDSETTGTQIGPFKLREKIGEGGMGAVYVADQKEPVQRRVALKIIKPGMDSQQVIARFEAERQALALMDHPNIAKVLDAGTTERGRPYFVMELVNGLPITKYCDEQHLSPRERLELFIPICQAVQHAHQKGIIHRDLKPSNILVAQYDGRPVPKVIDFGVAKATSRTLTEKSVYTQLGQLVGTLEYMSPEQAERNQLDIDTRSDIYSLGVVLYELLTGETPFEGARLRSAAFDEMLRIIREEEPPKPSTKLSSSSSLPSVAASRHIEPHRLSAMVRGELDWIVMKALEKNRSRRYDSAGTFAADIDNFLHDQPVSAGPPSLAYRMRKLARRNKVMLSTLCAVAATVLIGFVATASQAIRATQAEQLAENRLDSAQSHLQLAKDAVADYLTRVAEDQRLQEADLSDLRRELLEAALPFYEKLVDEDPTDSVQRAAQGDALFRLGRIHDELGEYRQSLQDYQRMHDVFLSLLQAEPESVRYQRSLAGSLENSAFVAKKIGELDSAQDFLRRAILQWKSLTQRFPDDPDFRYHHARALNSQGNLLRELAKIQPAQEAFAESADLLAALIEASPESVLFREMMCITCHDYGLLLQELGELERSLELFTRAEEALLKPLAGNSTSPRSLQHLAAVHNARGNVLQELGDGTGAEKALQKALTISQGLVEAYPSQPSHRLRLAGAHNALGVLLRDQVGDLELALQHFQAAVREYERLRGTIDSTPNLAREFARAEHNLGRLLSSTKQHTAACQHLKTAIEVLQGLVADHVNVPDYRADLGRSQRQLGWIYRVMRQHPQAENLLRNSTQTVEPLVRSWPRVIKFRGLAAEAWNDLGVVLREQEDQDGARAAYETAIGHYRKLTDLSAAPSHKVGLGGAYCNLGQLEVDAGNRQDALRHFSEAATLLELVMRAGAEKLRASLYLRNVYSSRAEVYESSGDFLAAADDWERAVKHTSKAERPAYQRSLALSLARTGEHQRASAVAEALAKQPLATPLDRVTAAIALATASSQVADEHKTQDQYRRRAVELLASAADAGFFPTRKDVHRLQSHPGFQSLQGRADFQSLLKKIEANIREHP